MDLSALSFVDSIGLAVLLEAMSELEETAMTQLRPVEAPGGHETLAVTDTTEIFE